jgi:hypothetical protein
MIQTTRAPFERVSKRRPCPVCGRPDWCLLASDGSAALCPRTDNGHPINKSGTFAGFLHKLSAPDWEPDFVRPASMAPKPRPEGLSPEQIAELAAKFLKGAAGRLGMLAQQLGVSETALAMLHTGYWAEKCLWTWPMRDDNNKITGFRTRTADGRKLAVAGSKSGLFIPVPLPFPISQLYVVEGPTSVAAMLDMGLTAVGRPSCSSGTDLLLEVVKIYQPAEVIVLGDHDEEKWRNDGSTFRPGQDGARRACEEIARLCPTKLVVCPVQKDARDWLHCGATGNLVRRVVGAQPLFRV